MSEAKLLVISLTGFLLSTGFFCTDATLCAPLDGSNTKVFHIPENSANGTFVGNIGVEGTIGQNITLNFAEPYLAFNQCGAYGKKCNSWLGLEASSQELMLFLNEDDILDRDGPQGIKRIDVNVVCTVTSGSDTGRQENTYIVLFVDDLNDNDPKFAEDSISVSVNELTPKDTKILTVAVSDEDEISNITYRLSSQVDSFFAIPNPEVGDVVLSNELDYEAMKFDQSVITILIEAEDLGTDLTRTATATVLVNILDGNDQPPEFAACVRIADSCAVTSYKARIPRLSKRGQLLSNLTPEAVSAFDQDSDLIDPTKIRYSLHPDPDDVTNFATYFGIDENTAEIHVENDFPVDFTPDEINLFIKAVEMIDNTQYAFARIAITIVDVLADLYPPEIQNGDITGYINPAQGDVVIVRNIDGSLVRLVVTDKDYLGSPFIPRIDFEVVSEAPFEVTSTGHIIYKAAQDSPPGSIQVRAINIQSTSNQTRTSKPITLKITVSETDRFCQFYCCGSNREGGLIAGISTTATLLFLALIAVIMLSCFVSNQRREMRKSSLEGFQNHKANSLGGTETGNPSSGAENRKKSRGMFHFSSPLSSISRDRNKELTRTTDETAHCRSHNRDKSSAYFANGNSNDSVDGNEESPSIAPYDSFSPEGDQQTNLPRLSWDSLGLKESISFDKLSVEQDMLHSSQKRGYQGFLTMHNGHISKCYVKIYPESYSHKRSLSMDLVAMNEVLNVRLCTQINLVKFFGVSLHSGSVYAVNEFVTSASDLRTALRKSRMINHPSIISSFTGSQLSNFALAIADGLRYLHEHSVTHGSLCCSQIILTDQLIPKLKGCCGKNNPRLRKPESLRWTAPEVVLHKEFSFASDVWSYAVVVWEIASLGGLPYHTVAKSEMRQNFETMKNGECPLPNCRNVARRLWTILRTCWHIKPTERPTIAEVYKRLLRLMEVTTPIFVSVTTEYVFAPTVTAPKRP